MAGESRSVARVVAALIVATWLVGVAPVLLGGRTFAAEPHVAATLPWFDRLAGAVADGHLPEWDDASGLGSAVALESGRPLCYPPAWVVGALPRPWGTDLLVLAHLLLFGLGAASWARRLGADPVGAVVAGGGAALSVAATGALTAGAAVCAAAWLPWVGWAADRMAAAGRGEPIRALVARALGLAVVLAALLLAAGGATGAGLAAPAVAGAAIAARAPRAVRAWVGLLGACAAGLLLSAAAWAPAALAGALRLSPGGSPGLDFEPAEILALVLAFAGVLAGAAVARRAAAAAIGIAALAALAPISADGFPAALAAVVYPLAGLGASAAGRALARVERLHRLGPAVTALVATAAIGPLAARAWRLPLEEREVIAEPPALLAGAAEDAAVAGIPAHLTQDPVGRPEGGPNGPKGRDSIEPPGSGIDEGNMPGGAASAAGSASEVDGARPADRRDASSTAGSSAGAPEPPVAGHGAPFASSLRGAAPATASSAEPPEPPVAGHGAPFASNQRGAAPATASSAGAPEPPVAGHGAPFASNQRGAATAAGSSAGAPEPAVAGHGAPLSSGQRGTSPVAAAAPASSAEPPPPPVAGHGAPFATSQRAAPAGAPPSTSGGRRHTSAGHGAPFASSERARPSSAATAAQPAPAGPTERAGEGGAATSSSDLAAAPPSASGSPTAAGEALASPGRVPIATSSSRGGAPPLTASPAATPSEPGGWTGPRRRIAWPEHVERGYRDAPPETGARFGFAYVPGRDRERDPELAALWRASSGAGKRLLDLFDVDYAVVPATVAVPAAMPVVGTSSSGERVLVESDARRARAFVASRWSWHADADALRAALFPPAPDQRGSLSLGEVRLLGAGAPPPGPARGPRPSPACAIESARPERVRLGCRSGSGGYAVLLDRAAPGWSARVDGDAAAIVTADLLVRAVAVPPGMHRIDFEYQTPGLRLAAILSGAAWLNALALALLLRRLRAADQPRTRAVPIEPG